MTKKETQFGFLTFAIIFLVVDSMVYEHPMGYRPSPHNMLGHLLPFGEWVRGLEQLLAIALLLGFVTTVIVKWLKKKHTKEKNPTTP